MPLEHTPLDPEALGADAQRALAGPMRAMAARGLAPIADPADFASVLYQLAVGPEAEHRADAERAAAELPDAVLQGALASASIDPRVVDFFAWRVVPGREDLLEIAVQNARAAPETLADVAGRASARLVDVIADNQTRLIESPEIIAAMYKNPRAPMSTVDRAVELAVRQGVKVRGIPAWDEVAAAAGKAPQATPGGEGDRLFADAVRRAGAEDEGRGEIVEVDEDEDDEQGRGGAADIPLHQMTVPQKIRLATLGSASIRATLIKDATKPVAMAAIKAPTVTEAEVKKYAGNTGLHEDIIKYIASRREWTKMYSVKLSLVNNPKTPVASSTRLLPHLRERDIRAVSRSKGVPSAVAAQARKLLTQRQRG